MPLEANKPVYTDAARNLVSYDGPEFVPETRTINGQALSSDITLTAEDVGADAAGSAAAVQLTLTTLIDALGSAAYADVADFDAAGSAAAVAAQLSSYVPVTRTINGHALDNNVTISADDLGLVIGVDVQAHSATLDEYAATNPTTAGLALLVAADASAQRTALELGSLATQNANAVAITGGTIAGLTSLGTTKFTVNSSGGVTFSPDVSSYLALAANRAFHYAVGTTNGASLGNAAGIHGVALGSAALIGWNASSPVNAGSSDVVMGRLAAGRAGVGATLPTDDGVSAWQVNGGIAATGLRSFTPTQAAGAVAGNPSSLIASGAVAGSSIVGAAAGGPVNIIAGAAARLTSGNANGGDINLTTGTGVGTGVAGAVKVSTDVRGIASFAPVLDLGVTASGMLTIKRIDALNSYLAFGYDGTNASAKFASSGRVIWSGNATNANTTPDSGMARNAAGVLEVNNGSSGTWRDLKLRTLIVDQQVNHKSYTVATVPSPATAGGEIYVSDEVGGAVLAFSDSVNWRRVTDRAIVS